MIISTEIEADVARANLFNPIIIAEDDENSHRLVTKVIVNGDWLLISPSSSLNKLLLCYERADGVKGAVIGTIANNMLRFDLPDNMFILDDLVKCDIVISYSKRAKRHTLSLNGDNLIVTETTSIIDCPLRTGLFYIDSQWRVMTEGNRNGGSL